MNTEPFIRIHPADDVIIARRQLVGGTVLPSVGITVAGLIPPGHKVAVRDIAAGQPVRRYNQVIPPPSTASCAKTAAWPRGTTSACSHR